MLKTNTILSQHRTAGVTGSITINREPINRTVFRKNSAFITQDIALLDYLTTMETLRFAAELKLSTCISKQSKSDIVNDIVRLLGLQKCTRNYVYHLSGGEKKRLAIAVELITNPAVMFFDEPTRYVDFVCPLSSLLYDGANKSSMHLRARHMPNDSNKFLAIVECARDNSNEI